MTSARRWLLPFSLLLSALMLLACGDSEDTDDAPKEYDQELLGDYREALPDVSFLGARTPGLEDAVDRATSGQVTQGLRNIAQEMRGEDALYPMWSRPLVRSVNGTTSAMTETLRAITSRDPSLFREENKEFVWGPFSSHEDVGFLSVYMRENDPGDDFRYTYVFLRSIRRSLDEATPIIWGGTNRYDKDAKEQSGVTLWDFEANKAFEDLHNPDHGPLDRGRFVSLYHTGTQDRREGHKTRYVLASFRNFVPAEAAEEPPINLDYFFGSDESPNNNLRFLNYAGFFDIGDSEDRFSRGDESAREYLDVHMAFLDEGMGRAEVLATGGDIDRGPELESVSLHECWNDRIETSYLQTIGYDEEGEWLWEEEDGEEEDCGPVFRQTLKELYIPSLDDVDPELRRALDQLATEGIPY